ncbi:Uncharacterised protein [Mycobacteroides abscessus]|nr:Uncharacterised protein [Mycobacteroides abscessus]
MAGRGFHHAHDSHREDVGFDSGAEGPKVQREDLPQMGTDRQLDVGDRIGSVGILCHGAMRQVAVEVAVPDEETRVRADSGLDDLRHRPVRFPKRRQVCDQHVAGPLRYGPL